MHARNVLTLAAAEGARAAALAGSDASVGVARSRDLLTDTVSAQVIESVQARPTVVDGLPVMQVSIQARIPLVGLPLSIPVEVTGHALREGGAAW